MPDNQPIALDRTDEAILQALQSDGRISTADLARAVSDFERLTGRIATLGPITTNVVYSGPLTGHRLTPARRAANPAP